jgi:hypothetical protein
MCAEANTVLRAVAEDFFFNCWYLEFPSDNGIGHIPRCVHDHPQDQVNDFFSICVILPAALGPGVYSALTEINTRSRKIMFLPYRRL